jgi:hypothetical protein
MHGTRRERWRPISAGVASLPEGRVLLCPVTGGGNASRSSKGKSRQPRRRGEPPGRKRVDFVGPGDVVGEMSPRPGPALRDCSGCRAEGGIRTLKPPKRRPTVFETRRSLPPRRFGKRFAPPRKALRASLRASYELVDAFRLASHTTGIPDGPRLAAGPSGMHRVTSPAGSSVVEPVGDLLAEERALHVRGAEVDAAPHARIDDLLECLGEAVEAPRRTRRWRALIAFRRERDPVGVEERLERVHDRPADAGVP